MELDLPTLTPARQTFCPLYKGDSDELVIGDVVRYVSPEGEELGYGHPGGLLAQALIHDETPYEVEELEDHERAPGGVFCDDCSAMISEQRVRFTREVISGGVHWSCDECGKFGIIIANDSRGFAADTRGAVGVKPPNQLGVKFDRCIQHQSEEDPTTGVQ